MHPFVRLSEDDFMSKQRVFAGNLLAAVRPHAIQQLNPQLAWSLTWLPS